jgi:NADH:ubiquinone reductase (H+-translocating)
MNSQKLPHIVVIGGGAGGIELVTRLGNSLGKNKKAIITLVDKQETHIWKPLLHEVAAGSLDSNLEQLNFYSHSMMNNYYFHPGEMQSLNRDTKTITIAAIKGENGDILVAERKLCYDILVIAIGSQSNDFNTPGVKDNCLVIDNLEQANIFHKRYIEKLLSLEFAEDIIDNRLNIVIVGGGATGIELAAELKHTLNASSSYNFKSNNIHLAKIIVVEGGNRILPMLPENISQSITSHLSTIGIEIITSEVAVEVSKNTLRTKNGKAIPFNFCIWAAGIKSDDFLSNLDGLETDKINRLIVNESLQTSQDKNIFAMGDCAAVIDKQSGRPLAPRAQVAHQEAKFLADTLTRLLKNKPLKKFEFHDKGSLVALSCYGAYGDITGFGKMRFFVGGKVAQLMYRSLHFMHLSTLYGIKCAMLLRIAKKMLSRSHTRLNLHFSKH